MLISIRNIVKRLATSSAAFIISSISFGLLVKSCNQNNGSAHCTNNIPNIIIILADDMGYGDVQSFNPISEIPTPNLNKLSEEGIMFTDAHTPSSICTPTRYGLLTGRYCWRTSLKRGVLRGYDLPLIEEDRITIADYLKTKDIQRESLVSGIWAWDFKEILTRNHESEKRFDLTKPLHSSPNDNGFDYSFVLACVLGF